MIDDIGYMCGGYREPFMIEGGIENGLTPIELDVLEFARKAHEGQRRKFTGEDYIVHPINVTKNIIETIYHDRRMVVCALLHDVVEDTDVRVVDIYTRYGQQTAIDVRGITKLDGGSLNRAGKAVMNNKHLAKQNKVVQTVKCFDIMDNCKDIVDNDPDFAFVYLLEKEKTLGHLTKVHNAVLNMALDFVRMEQTRLIL